MLRRIRALVAATVLLAVPHAFTSEHHFISPNGQLEAYTIAGMPDGSGMKLLVRRTDSQNPGVLLRENNRWIDAKWSPDSRFIAVIDHLDGHISDVYIFGIADADAAPTLLFHMPELHKYDVKWDVMGGTCLSAK